MVANEAQKACETDTKCTLGLLSNLLEQLLFISFLLMRLLQLFNSFLETAALMGRLEEHTGMNGNSGLSCEEREDIGFERCKPSRFRRAEQQRPIDGCPRYKRVAEDRAYSKLCSEGAAGRETF